MSLSSFEKKLKKQIEAVLAPASPGLQVQVHQTGKKVCDLAVGETYAYYDFASLTKVVFTVQAMMKAYDEGRWNLKSKVKEFCPWFAHDEVTVAQCLTHSTGLTWWMPLYQQLDLSTSSLNRWTEGARILRSLPLQKSEASVYSDLGFILLGHVLESLYALPLIEVWERLKADIYPRSTLEFHRDNQPVHSSRYYAPTERCRWRQKTIQGEVHDDNTWAFGGVSTHAGLFGSIDDLGWFALYLRTQMKGFSKLSIKSKTAQLFASRARPQGKGDWALGYMMPTPGGSSSGNYFSPDSIGHTGFTGTSIWYDPSRDLSVSILSNRVFYGRENKEFASLRPQIHNWIIEGLKRV
ncbi:MAG: serine hydrolase domain-containing protein [Pseudobdellovibrionaceae bacterium]